MSAAADRLKQLALGRTYQIDNKQKKIWIATTLPSADPTARVQLNFEIISLLNNPNFEAISCCCGDSKITK